MIKDLTLLKRLNEVPKTIKGVVINTSIAVILYLEITKKHCFYVTVRKGK